ITDYIRSTVKSVGRLKRILSGSEKTGNYQKNEVIDLTKEICDDFTGRFLRALLKYEEVIFIPCGKVATAFVEHFVSLHKDRITDIDDYFPDWAKGIPHPSYGHWAESRDNAKVKKMCAEIKKLSRKKSLPK
ncbi:MAG: hypothetical protein U1C33_08200, partial [Candidatus Cloacimonadaceae bacterium]|nr:hypothetical protein [Candidatus Cloacimonadaceae bacterium]